MLNSDSQGIGSKSFKPRIANATCMLNIIIVKFEYADKKKESLAALFTFKHKNDTWAYSYQSSFIDLPTVIYVLVVISVS